MTAGGLNVALTWLSFRLQRMPKGEAARVNGRDCEFDKGEITVLGDPATGTKNWEIRRVPMIPDMRRLLERVQGERGEKEFRRIRSCGSTNARARSIQLANHSASRGLPTTIYATCFPTRCIESGVDIPTVSRWLGHKDGGALAMKTYGHLRDQHSANMAQKVAFTETATNIVRLPLPARSQIDEAVATDGTGKQAIAQAKAKYTYPWWASKNAMEVLWGQLNEAVQIVPLDKLHACAKEAMNREDIFGPAC